jgi:hypothetical protein
MMLPPSCIQQVLENQGLNHIAAEARSAYEQLVGQPYGS